MIRRPPRCAYDTEFASVTYGIPSNGVQCGGNYNVTRIDYARLIRISDRFRFDRRLGEQ
jgi:hypothetical protein